MSNLIKILKQNWIYFIALIVPLLIIFKALFSNSSLALGDAPYFFAHFPEWFLKEPGSWTQRGISFGGMNQFIWIWPYMSLISIFQRIFALNHWFTIRFFFYIPSLILSTFGAYFFSRSFAFSKITSFFAAMFSVFNTYYLIIWDGGQVGIVLAYSLFPWVLLVLRKYLQNKTTKFMYVSALFVLSLLTLADPRISLISIFTIVLLELKSIKKFTLVLLPWLFLNSYWLYPLLQEGTQRTAEGTLLQTTSFLNGLFLYAPNWYENLYGKVTYPSVLFFVIPFLLLTNFFIEYKHKKKLLVLFLIFIFLIKGTTEPFGGLYTAFTKLPFGSAFRDSTKFFIPTIFIAGILLGRAIEFWKTKLKSKFVFPLFYFVLLIPLLPALLGKMNFVLSGHESNPQVADINALIQSSSESDRTVWFPERDPASFESPTHEIVDGKDLVKMRVFSSMNVGTDDLFNFLNDWRADWWFDLLNVTRLTFIKDPRTIFLTDIQKKDAERLNDLLPTLPYLSKVSSLPVYENQGYLPRIFGTQKLFVVVGSDSIYSLFTQKDSQFKPYNYAFAFVDDGKWDPTTLSEYATTSAIIINNSKSENELAMSMLQKSFVAATQAKSSEFAVYGADQYLKYKYELLIRNIKFDDFDYNKGISFTTHENEQMVFPVTTSETGEYMLSIRSMSMSTESGLEVTLDNNKIQNLKPSDSLLWNTVPVTLSKGTHTLALRNPGGVQVFNVLSVVPKLEYNQALQKAKDYMTNFPTYIPSDLPTSLLKSTWEEVPFTQTGMNRFMLKPKPSTNWITWTNTFSPNWRLSRDRVYYQSIPFYSSVNGFYKRPGWNEMTLEFSGQESVRWGIYYSIASLLLLVIILLCI